MAEFQVANPANKSLCRKDHIWRFCKDHWKCVICGALTKVPPRFPTRKDWEPDRYEKLSEEDRALCPFFGYRPLEVE